MDLTTVAVGLPGTGLWAAWWPFALVLRWLLSWHLVLVLDHFSRSFLAFRLARGEPSAIERFILSLKQELLWRVHVPVRQDAMTEPMAAHQRWYDEHRPHESLAGRAPAEMLAGAPPPAHRETIEPRELLPRGRATPRRRARAPLALVVGHVGGRRELPVVAVRDAA